MHKPDTVVLLSGGLDSTTTAHLAMEQGRLAAVVLFSYGQPHGFAELGAAAKWAKKHKVREHYLQIALRAEAMDLGIGTPGARVVPGRNLVLIAHAINIAAATGASSVWVGCNADDAADYPDCRPPFILAASRLGELFGVSVEAPLLHMTKADVVREAMRLGVDIGATWSCYQPTAMCQPCGTCNACVLRESALTKAGTP